MGGGYQARASPAPFLMPNLTKIPDPTEAEIKAACEAIQATWSLAERRKRCVYEVKRVVAPQYESDELFGEVDWGER